MNPDGIDANFFYGDFLQDQGEYPAALVAFEKALKAPMREGRVLADEGRRKEIETAIRKLKKKL